MAYVNLRNYIQNTLANDVAAYLNAKVANFPNVANYFIHTVGGDYFNEATVQAAMFMKINEWVVNNDTPNNVLVLQEWKYPGFENIADIAVYYNNAPGISGIYIEIKADQMPESVNYDIGLLDDIAGVQHSPITNGYAFYVVRNPPQGWTANVDPPIEPNIRAIAINVN